MPGAVLRVAGIVQSLKAGQEIQVEFDGLGSITLRHALSLRQIDVLLAGGAINRRRKH
jgi:hypothetical protein